MKSVPKPETKPSTTTSIGFKIPDYVKPSPRCVGFAESLNVEKNADPNGARKAAKTPALGRGLKAEHHKKTLLALRIQNGADFPNLDHPEDAAKLIRINGQVGLQRPPNTLRSGQLDPQSACPIRHNPKL